MSSLLGAFDFLRPLSSVQLAIISMCHELCILSCDKFKPTLLAALYQWVVVTSKTMDRRFRNKSTSIQAICRLPKAAANYVRKGVLIVSLTLTITRTAMAFRREKK